MNTNSKNSEDYLKSVLNKETGFKTPENYFSDAEQRFSIFLLEEKILKESSFKTPNTYFEGLEDTILNKVISTKKEAKVISLKKRVFKIIPFAAAASVVLFLGLNSSIFNPTKSISFNDLADTEVENWISNHINLINDTDFAETYSIIDFNELYMVPNSISNDEIENYLNNQDNLSLLLENE